VLRRRSIAVKFFLTYFVIAAAALAFAGVASWLQFRKYAGDETDRQLLLHARILAAAVRPSLEASPPDLPRVAAEVDRMGRGLDLRLTVVLPGGEVAADSSVGAAKVPDMENHGDREEIRSALAGREASASRRSITEKADEHYVAVPIRDGARTLGVARVSLRVSGIEHGLDRIRNATLLAGFVAFLFTLAGTAVRARQVTGPLEAMRASVGALAGGDLGRRASVDTGDELEEMADGLNAMADRLESTIRQLDDGKARLATILENLSEGVLVVDGERAVRTINREAARLLGASGDAAGRPYTDLVREPDLLSCIEALRGGNPLPARDIVLPSAADGKSRVLRVTGIPVRFGDGDAPDLLLTLRDVTEEKRLARIKSEFVSNASHELRTPLTNVRGYLEAVQDALAEGQPVDPSFLETAHANAIRMELLVADLLELSRAESANVPLALETLPLDAFLERVVAPLRPAVERAGVTLVLSGGPEPLRADLRKLSTALSNLVENAVKYGRPEGTVSLGGSIDGAEAVFEVADDGPGIAPEHLPRIFERFYRVEKGRSRTLGGTGLGLSIVKHIVDSHGGSVSVDSTVGKGSRFTVRIPIK
jgi:two-component system phosphate regulon sensor histidine kinase PhoR